MTSARILITGAGGFIGSHLTELCVERGHSVVAFLHYNSAGSWGWLEDSSCRNDIEVVLGDIRDLDSVTAALGGCDTVFHLAALAGIPHSLQAPHAYIGTNIEGTYNVLQAARARGVSNILITSTSETYGTAQYNPIDENHPLVAQSPYAATKIAADQLALSFHRSFGLPVKVVRPFNAFGPRQSTRAVIPTIITQLLAKEEPIRLGNLYPTRDFTFVTDTAEAFLEVAGASDLFGEVVNVGTGREVSVLDTVTLIGKILGIQAETVLDQGRARPDPMEVKRLCCDNTKIMERTEWRPKYDLEAGLEATIRWFEGNLPSYKPDLYQT
ncbi:GDP-mannose 4,6-dehydratase [Gemmatimonadota bacterium]